MAIRAFICNLRRAKLESAARSISSVAPGSNLPGRRHTEIKDEDSRLRFPPGESPATILKTSTDEVRRFALPELKRGYKKLLRAERYLDALEILEFMEVHSKNQMSAVDYANGIELTIRLRGITKAEECFERLPNSASRRAAFPPLLSTYVKQRDTIKAEAFMVKLNDLGLILEAHPFNEMMKLYMATSQYEKVHLVIEQMKQNHIPRNVLSYNLWMCACGEISDVEKAEMVYTEMVDDRDVEVGWSGLCCLANVYSKAGLVDKALVAVRSAEKKLSPCKRRGYFFLMTTYSSLKNREGVLRLWEASKAAKGRITCADYICVLSCLVKLGDVVKAERVFTEWESTCHNYDIRVPNVLLGAYVRSGMMQKAESLHLHTIEKGGNPNYKTWEILIEGWVKSGEMEKAISGMKRGLSRMKDCHWRPSENILMAVAEFFVKQGNLEGASNYLKIIHHLGIASLPLYKLVLRFHHSASKPAFYIIEMMKKDKIQMDEETCALVEALTR
ncbi:Pentatricopeptide repeat-containing protein At5g27460 [Linum grandiflorum]